MELFVAARGACGDTPEPHVRILVVEDHEDSLDFLVEFLALHGFETTGAPDAESALASFEERPFQAVLTDIDLPGMSGCDLATSIRARGGPPPHLDAMSGIWLSPDDDELFEHFFIKPLNLDKLMSTLASY